MVVVDTDSGKVTMAFDAGGGADEMFFDAAAQRIYLQGYEGIADVWKEVDPTITSPSEKFREAANRRLTFTPPPLHR